MKHADRTTLLFAAALTAAAIGMTGCVSADIERPQPPTTTIQAIETEIRSILVQLDATGASLAEVIKPGQPDVRAAFGVYKGNVATLESMAQDFLRHNDEMKARGKDYFEEWQKDGDAYRNPKLRELDDQRRAELALIYGRVAEISPGVNDAIKAYVLSVKAINGYLADDLTSAGIETIVPISRIVVKDGDTLEHSIENLHEAISRARAEVALAGI